MKLSITHYCPLYLHVSVKIFAFKFCFKFNPSKLFLFNNVEELSHALRGLADICWLIQHKTRDQTTDQISSEIQIFLRLPLNRFLVKTLGFHPVWTEDVTSLGFLGSKIRVQCGEKKLL